MSKTRLAILGLILIFSCKPAQTPGTVSTTATTATVPPITTTVPVTTTNPLPPFKLDHYKFWKVQPQSDKPIGITVMLQGQFDQKPWRAAIRMAEYIGNPVEKRVAGNKPNEIQNPRLHYVAYSIQADPQPPPPPIEVTNQFGTHRPWRLSRPAWLLVPADKKLDGKPEAPPRGDHFVCYAAEAQQPQIAVSLMDQFDRAMNKPEEVRDFQAAFFCVPVTKQRPGKEPEPILDKETHLAIYRISKTEFTKPIWTNDQFGVQQLKVLYSEFVALPSLKYVKK